MPNSARLLTSLLLALPGLCALAVSSCQPQAPPTPAPKPAAPSVVRWASYELTHSASAAQPEGSFFLRSLAADQPDVRLTPLLRVDGVTAPLQLIPTAQNQAPMSLEQTAGGFRLHTTLVRAADDTLRLMARLRPADATATHRGTPQLGWRVDWPGRQTFVPGLGFATDGSARAAWFGRRSAAGALGFASPSLETLLLTKDHVGHLGATSWSDAAPDHSGSLSTEHRLLLSQPSLAEVAAMGWRFAGTTLGELKGALQPAPDWGAIEARAESGELILTAPVTRQGGWRLLLPPGKYRVRSVTPGGSDEVAAKVSAGGSSSVTLVPPTPGTLTLIGQDSTGQALPLRWILRGIEETPDPEFTAEPGINSNMAFTLRGSARVSVPAGKYRVTATHGPEYSLYDASVEIAAGRGATVRASLTRELSIDDAVGCDLHLHQAPSFDSEVSLEDRLTSLLADGIGFAAATDHNVVTDYAPTLAKLAPDAKLATVPGVEITTQRWGHFNAFPYALGPPPPTRDRSPAQIFSQVRADAPGALIQINHPRMGDIGYFNQGELDLTTGAAKAGFSYEFDTVEVFNGFDLGNPGAVTRSLESWYGLLNAGWRFTAVGNSDSHKLTGQYAGYPRTYVRVDLKGAAPLHERVTQALKRGAAWVTNGPRLDVTLDGAQIGDQVQLKPDSKLHVEIQTASFISVSSVEIVLNGERFLEQKLAMPLRGKSLSLDFPLAPPRDSWVVVLVRGTEPLDAILPRVDAKPLAFSNPIFIDADGDGSFSAPSRQVRAGVEAAAARDAIP